MMTYLYDIHEDGAFTVVQVVLMDDIYRMHIFIYCVNWFVVHDIFILWYLIVVQSGHSLLFALLGN